MPTPKNMKAAVIESFEGLDSIHIKEVPIPEPLDHEVQIAIQYAGINPVDWKICEGMFKKRMDYEFPIILGWDCAGIVSRKGKKVMNLKEGDAVFAYCRKERLHDGSFAQYICLNAQNVARKPDKISFAQAASVPLSALTAWQSLFDSAHLRSKENVLIHAGAGGVGGFAIQFAKLTGAKVITTASAKHHAYVKKLGADVVIDYTKENFVDKVHTLVSRGVDVTYDTVGGETLKKSYLATKEGGRLVSIADQVLSAQRNIEAKYVFVAPNGEELGQIATLIESGKLQLPSLQEFPFEDVKSALRKSHMGGVEGKIVLKVA